MRRGTTWAAGLVLMVGAAACTPPTPPPVDPGWLVPTATTEGHITPVPGAPAYWSAIGAAHGGGVVGALQPQQQPYDANATTVVRIRPDGTRRYSVGLGAAVQVTSARSGPAGDLYSGGRIPGTGGLFREMRLWRFLADGSPDPGFGSAGLVVLPTPPVPPIDPEPGLWSPGSENSRVEDTAVDAHGRIYALVSRDDGAIYRASYRFHYIARLHPDGTLDAGWGDDGYVPLYRTFVYWSQEIPGRLLFDEQGVLLVATASLRSVRLGSVTQAGSVAGPVSVQPPNAAPGECLVGPNAVPVGLVRSAGRTLVTIAGTSLCLEPAVVAVTDALTVDTGFGTDGGIGWPADPGGAYPVDAVGAAFVTGAGAAVPVRTSSGALGVVEFDVGGNLVHPAEPGGVRVFEASPIIGAVGMGSLEWSSGTTVMAAAAGDALHLGGYRQDPSGWASTLVRVRTSEVTPG